MASTKPTIVLVPGSFCSAALLWDAVIDKLHNAVYDAIAVELQTVSPPSTAPAKTMADDAAHIHGIVEALANDEKEVLVVMHSYGGIPGTQAVKGLTRKERQEQGKAGGVTGLVYVSSLLINEGESSEDSFAAFRGSPPEFFKVHGEYLSVEPIGSAAVIFADLPKDLGEAWARKMPGQAMKAFGEKMTSTSHHDVPVTYLKCTDDNVVIPAHQQKMIDDFKSVSRTSVDVIEIASGHCPMVVHVEKTAEVIMDAARKARVEEF